MYDNLERYGTLSKQQYETLWQQALLVFDTNVLLDLYRLPEKNRDEFLSILNHPKIAPRIWIPYQVMLEFVHLSPSVINEQLDTIDKVINIINNTLSGINRLTSIFNGEISKLNLEKRHAHINIESLNNSSLFKDTEEKLIDFFENINKLKEDKSEPKSYDKVRTNISELFFNKVGNKFSETELQKIYAEGKIRYEQKIPPGFMDAGKDDFINDGGIIVFKKYGDLIIWKEIIQKSAKDNIQYLIFVSGDEKKDWWQLKESNRTRLGIRVELINEIHQQANSLKRLQIYNTSNFVKFSQEHLNVKDSKSLVEQTQKLIEVRYNENNYWQSETHSIANFLNSLKELFPNLIIIISDTYAERNFFKISKESLLEIFTITLNFITMFSKNCNIKINVFPEWYSSMSGVTTTDITIISLHFDKNYFTSVRKGHSMLGKIERLMANYGKMEFFKIGSVCTIQLKFRNLFLG